MNTSNLLVTFAYIPLSLLWVVPMARAGRIPAEDLRMSKRPFVVMGLLDAMSGRRSHGTLGLNQPYLSLL